MFQWLESQENLPTGLHEGLKELGEVPRLCGDAAQIPVLIRHAAWPTRPAQLPEKLVIYW